MGIFIFMVVAVIVIGLIGFIGSAMESSADAKRTPAQRKAVRERREDASLTVAHGPKNAAMVCPHCATKGFVRTKRITAKKGISGGKATGAILTGGVSLLATGLSRKEAQTQARCDNCSSTWAF